MASRRRCPRCGSGTSWILRNQRRRCARCRFDWRPGRLPLRLTPSQWRAVLRWFVRGQPSAQIAIEARLDRKRVLRALTIVRHAMACSGPRSRRALDRDPPTARAVTIALHADHGQVSADLLSDAETEKFQGRLSERGTGQPVAWPTSGTMGVVHAGHLYRTADPATGHSPDDFGQIAVFWAYLQRQLRAKGGIRRARLGLYLAEYAWRYNHRKVSSATQLRKLLALVRRWQADRRRPLPG